MSTFKPWDSASDTPKNRRIGFVIDHTNNIEYTIKKVLVRYLEAPVEKNEFIKSILFHSSVIGLGAKFKLLHHVAAIEKWPPIPTN